MSEEAEAGAVLEAETADDIRALREYARAWIEAHQR